MWFCSAEACAESSPAALSTDAATVPVSFADAVTQVLTDPELRQRLGSEGRRTAERVYSWEVIGAGLMRHYFTLLPSHPAPGPE